MHRNAFVTFAERVRVRLLLYFRWIIYSEEEALMASGYLRFLARLEEKEEQLLLPAAREVSIVSINFLSEFERYLNGLLKKAAATCASWRA